MKLPSSGPTAAAIARRFHQRARLALHRRSSGERLHRREQQRCAQTTDDPEDDIAGRPWASAMERAERSQQAEHVRAPGR
jgi:hypothetical protein